MPLLTKFRSVAALLLVVVYGSNMAMAQLPSSLKIGWVGPMSGATQKYAAYQSAILAEEDINASGGIAGRKVEILFQDGKGNSREAVGAAHYLIDIAKVNYIIGGHSTPESFPISSLAEQNKVLMLAAITSSPKLTNAGDYVFRVTAVNTQGVDTLLPYLKEHTSARRYAVLYEETDYARGLGEYFQDKAVRFGFDVAIASGYAPGEQDFRAILTRFKALNIDGIYLSVQAPDAAITILQRMAELHMAPQLVGNEISGNAVSANTTGAAHFENMVFAEPNFDPNRAETRAFIERYKKRFNVDSLPFGIWTAEAYDAVKVLADTIARCGDDVERVKKCLYQTKGYAGVSGEVGFDENGDGIRKYVIKEIHAGRIEAR